MKKYNIICFVALLLFLAACGKSWLDVNSDPNNPGSATPESLLPSAMVSLGSVTGGNYNLLGGIWSQYWTQSPGSNQYKYIDGYQIISSDFQAQWAQLYDGTLKNLRIVREEALTQKNYAYVYMATVLECYTYQVLVDLYDQIPFNEALNGETTQNLQPKYNNAATVYDSIAARLERLSSLDLSFALTTAQKKKDFIFNNNAGSVDYAVEMANWEAFTNTLLLKIYLRQMYVRPTVAQAGIAALYARNATFLTTDAKLDIFIDQAGKDNPLYESDRISLNTTNNLRASGTLYKYLTARNDPRRPYIYGAGTSIPQGDYSEFFTASQLAGFSIAVLNAKDPVYFISKAESYFLQAEAVAKGWGTSVYGDDSQLYNTGLNASFAKYTIKNGLADTAVVSTMNKFLAKNPYQYPVGGTFDAKQDTIIKQKWVSMAASQGIEAFFETNRTHVPHLANVANRYVVGTISSTTSNYGKWNGGELMYSMGGVTGGNFPKRLLFPNNERTVNTNTPTEVPIITKVWWDTK